MKCRIFLATLILMLGACTTTDYDPYVAATENQLETRSYQTRDFLDIDYQQLLQAMVSTLQDYHFRIREVDTDLGIITASQNTRRAGMTELTIIVKTRSDNQFAVRINMLTGPKAENEPEIYQKFFAAVSKQLHYQGSM